MSNVFHVLKDALNTFDSDKAAIEQINLGLKINRKLIVAFANAHAFNMSYDSSEFKNCLMDSDFLLRDGIGVKFLCQMFGDNPGANLNGTDFIPGYLASNSVNKKIALLGTNNTVLTEAKCSVEQYGGEVIATCNGFEEYEKYIELVKSSKPDIIILAMGMPKQEVLAQLLLREIDSGIIFCGGAILDFMSGKVDRAPLFIRNLGLEWLYRLYKEPVRLFKRYIFGNVKFLVLALLAKVAN